MKKFLAMVLTGLTIMTGTTYGFDLSTDSVHKNRATTQTINVYNPDTAMDELKTIDNYYIFFENHLFNATEDKLMQTYNPLYEYDSPFLGLPIDPYSYIDETGLEFKIHHPQRIVSNRYELSNDPMTRFQRFSRKIFLYDATTDYMSPVEYIKRIGDSEFGNIIQYHVYEDVNIVKVYFDDLSHLTIVYDYDYKMQSITFETDLDLLEAQIALELMYSEFYINDPLLIYEDDYQETYMYGDLFDKYNSQSIRVYDVLNWFTGEYDVKVEIILEAHNFEYNKEPVYGR